LYISALSRKRRSSIRYLTFPVYSHSHHAPYHHQLRKLSPQPLRRYSLPQLPISSLPLQNDNGAFLFNVKVLRSQSRRTYLIPAFSHAPSPTTLFIGSSKPSPYPLTHSLTRPPSAEKKPHLPLPTTLTPSLTAKTVAKPFAKKKTGDQHMRNPLKGFHQIKKIGFPQAHICHQQIPLSEG